MPPLPHPTKTLPPKRFVSIAWKIWLAIAIIFAGFIIVMVQNFWMGQYIQNKNQLVAKQFFPAALEAQQILSICTNQIREYEEAIGGADPDKLQSAASHSARITSGLERISTMSELPPALVTLAAENLALYHRYESKAFPLYSRMVTGPADQDILDSAADLARLAESLISSLTVLTSSMSHVVSEELHNSTALAQRHHKANLIVFLSAMVIASLLVAYILTNSILTPLKRTVAQANLMAAGDLSHKLDISQNDEIGTLAQAMNSMATQLESHYQELEDAVDEKTLILQKANHQLLMEIAQRRDTQHELLSAMAEVDKANRSKSSFLAMMSHELRTPMNGIIGMSSLALDTALNNTQQRYLSTIRNSAEALLTILNDILDFSKMEADKLALESMDFEPRQVMADISDLLAIEAEAKGLDFFTLTDPSMPDWLQGDAGRLRQILLNLAGNAIKFTETGEVAIRMEIIASTSDAVTIRFAVSDTGIGIAKERINQLFEPFTQADISFTRKFGGTGLGLSISKRLIQLMGGTIKAESIEGEGSTFWFTATFTRSAHGRQPLIAKEDRHLIYNEGGRVSPQSPPFQAPGKRILVADDDNTSLIVAQAILESFGCRVDLAHNGREVIDHLTDVDYDLILMDIQMPELDGLEATAIIKGWGQSPDTGKQAKSRTPIIAITADVSDGARPKYLAAGMADYLGKPLRPGILATCLRTWLPALQEEDKRQAVTTTQFSRERLLHRLGGDQQKMDQLIQDARSAIPRHLADLDAACSSNNCQQAEAACREIKKMGAHLGVASLQHHALHLCLAMENTDMDQTREHYHELRPLLTELLQSLAD